MLTQAAVHERLDDERVSDGGFDRRPGHLAVESAVACERLPALTAAE
jgi:hypothetical protein